MAGNTTQRQGPIFNPQFSRGERAFKVSVPLGEFLPREINLSKGFQPHDHKKQNKNKTNRMIHV